MGTATWRAERGDDGSLLFAKEPHWENRFGDLGKGPFAEIVPCVLSGETVETCDPPGDFWTVLTRNETAGMLSIAHVSDFPTLGECVAHVVKTLSSESQIEILYPWTASNGETVLKDEDADTTAVFDSANGRIKRFVGNPLHELATTVTCEASNGRNWRLATLVHADGRRTEPEPETWMAPDEGQAPGDATPKA